MNQEKVHPPVGNRKGVGSQRALSYLSSQNTSKGTTEFQEEERQGQGAVVREPRLERGEECLQRY